MSLKELVVMKRLLKLSIYWRQSSLCKFQLASIMGHKQTFQIPGDMLVTSGVSNPPPRTRWIGGVEI